MDVVVVIEAVNVNITVVLLSSIRGVSNTTHTGGDSEKFYRFI